MPVLLQVLQEKQNLAYIRENKPGKRKRKRNSAEH